MNTFTPTYAVAAGHRAEFDVLLDLQRQELRPQGINEELIFANLVQAAWNTQLVRRAETQALLERNEAQIERCARYSAQCERAYYRALSELRKLQTERALRQASPRSAEDSAPLEDAAPLADSAKVKKQTQSQAGPDDLDSFIRRMNAESRWAMVQLRALKAGIAPPPRDSADDFRNTASTPSAPAATSAGRSADSPRS